MIEHLFSSGHENYNYQSIENKSRFITGDVAIS